MGRKSVCRGPADILTCYMARFFRYMPQDSLIGITGFSNRYYRIPKWVLQLSQMGITAFPNRYYGKLCHIARKSSDGIVQNLGYRYAVHVRVSHDACGCRAAFPSHAPENVSLRSGRRGCVKMQGKQLGRDIFLYLSAI